MLEQMLTASKALTTDLKEENKKLKDQNALLFDRIQALEKTVALEEERRKRAEEEVQLEEQLRALGTFKAMQDVDLEQFLKDYNDELNKIRTVLNEEEKARQDAKPLVFI
jgi:5-bromo-4-chloroindolyl phosphate hydrolysis protein